MSGDVRSQVFQRDEHQCRNCSVDASEAELQYHHIVPLSRGGQDIISNCVTLCSTCHDKTHGVERPTNHAELTRNGQLQAADELKFKLRRSFL